MTGMKLGALVVWSSLAVLSATAGGRRYQTHYLEDYIVKKGHMCELMDAYKVNLDLTGNGSAVIVRGSRSSRRVIDESVCCLILRTKFPGQLNVQLDEAYLNHVRIRKPCYEFLKFMVTIFPDIDIHTSTESSFCEHEEDHFDTPRDSLRVLYVLNSTNFSDFEKLKFVVTVVRTGKTRVRLIENGPTDVYRGVHAERCNSTIDFKCRDRGCIWKGLECDAYNNCGDWSDESDCGSNGFFVNLVGVSCGLFIACLIWCVCCYRCYLSRSKSKQSQMITTFLQETTPAPNGRQGLHDKPHPRPEMHIRKWYQPRWSYSNKKIQQK